MRATLAILGGGASGALVATQLLRLASRPLLVVLVERGGGLARGVAYGTRWVRHLLNVPAGRMSALPDDPSHFVRWLQGRLPLHRHDAEPCRCRRGASPRREAASVVGRELHRRPSGSREPT